MKEFLIDQHLLEDPLIGHHMYAACDMAFEGVKSDKVDEMARSIRFNANKVMRYFKALDKNLEINAEACDSIVGLCGKTREAVDQLVVKQKAIFDKPSRTGGEG